MKVLPQSRNIGIGEYSMIQREVINSRGHVSISPSGLSDQSLLIISLPDSPHLASKRNFSINSVFGVDSSIRYKDCFFRYCKLYQFYKKCQDYSLHLRNFSRPGANKSKFFYRTSVATFGV